MTSTKSFTTKNTGILIVAIFSIAISMGLSQVTSANAQTDIVDCVPEVDDESIDTEVNDARSCGDEDEEGEESNATVRTPSQDVVSTVPASADPEDNVIKPINLNKGLTSDKPLKTNNDVNKNQDEDAEAMMAIEDDSEFKQQLDQTSSVSEIYESFDLPYTALYKNP